MQVKGGSVEESPSVARRLPFGFTRAGFAFVAAFVWVAPAVGSPCGAPDFLASFPSDGATAVPVNAALTAHYAATAGYADEPIVLEHQGDGTIMLTGTFDSREGLLSVSPDEPLVPGDDYVVTWPRLRAIGQSSKGKGATVSFRAGDVTDTEPPSFAGLSSIAWDVRREHDDCTDSLEDRFAFDLGLGRASDDGGRASLAVVVFQTEGPGISKTDPPVEVLTAPIPPPGETLLLERALDDASGRTCFSALVRDLTGAVAGGDTSICTTTVRPPFFYGCRVARTGPALPALGIAPVAAAAALLLNRRRGRRRGS